MGSKFFNELNDNQKDMLLTNSEKIYSGAINTQSTYMTICTEMDKIHKLWAGEHYDLSMTTMDTDEQVVVNHCFKNTETLYAILKDMKLSPKVYPRFDTLPRTEMQPAVNPQTGQPAMDENGEPIMNEVIVGSIDVRARAEMLTKVLDSVRRESRLDDVIDSATHDACEYGTGLAKPYYDPDGRKGKGLIRASRVPIKNAIPADDGIEYMQDQPYFSTVTAMPWSKIVREYGLSDVDADKLKGINMDSQSSMTNLENPANGITLTSSANKQNTLDAFGTSKLLPVVQLYVKHREVFTQFMDREDKEMNKMKEDLDGIMITFCSGVLLDVDKFYGHGCIPVAVIKDYDYPGKFYGAGEVSIAAPINQQINYMWSLILANIRAMGSGRILMDEDVVTDDFTSKPGEVIRVKNGALQAQKIQFTNGLPVNPQMYNFISAKERELETISGITATTSSGQAPGGGVEAAKAIQMLVQSASQRIRPKLINKSKFIQDFYEQILFLILEYYDDRVLQIVGEENEQNYIHFKTEVEENNGWYTISIEGTEQLPLSRGQYASLMIQLMNSPLEQEGKISERTVFDALGIPRASELAKEVETRRQARQQQQQQMMEAQASAAAKMQASNNSALMKSTNPEAVAEGLGNMGLTDTQK